MAEIQRTLVLLKPDAVQRGLAGELIKRLEQTGLKLIGLKLMKVSEALAKKHYSAHEGKKFFPGLVSFITSSPIVAIAVEGPSAVELVRKVMGKTNPVEAAPGTIRGDFGVDIGRNLIHGSDSPESAAKELAIFFTPAELVSYSRDYDRWIIE